MSRRSGDRCQRDATRPRNIAVGRAQPDGSPLVRCTGADRALDVRVGGGPCPASPMDRRSRRRPRLRRRRAGVRRGRRQRPRTRAITGDDRVDVRTDDDLLTIVVRDDGSWRVSAHQPPRGLGLPIMMALMDNVTVDTTDGTAIRLSRRLSSRPEGESWSDRRTRDRRSDDRRRRCRHDLVQSSDTVDVRRSRRRCRRPHAAAAVPLHPRRPARRRRPRQRARLRRRSPRRCPPGDRRGVWLGRAARRQPRCR